MISCVYSHFVKSQQIRTNTADFHHLIKVTMKNTTKVHMMNIEVLILENRLKKGGRVKIEKL